MKKKIIIGSLLLLAALFSTSDAISPEKKELIEALKSSNPDYFKTVKSDSLKIAITSKNKSSIQKMGLASIPSIIGAFDNQDADVRKLIYTELLFPEIFTANNTLTSILENKEQKIWIEQLREKMFKAEEKDLAYQEVLDKVILQYNYNLREAINKKNYKSISYFTPEQFKTYNAQHEKTVIGRFGKASIKTLIKAIGEERISKQTKMLIIESLKFSNTGGISKVIPKQLTRLKRAEDIYLIADKEKEPSVQNKLLDLAEIYMTSVTDEK